MEEKSIRGSLCNTDCWKLECFGKVSLYSYSELTENIYKFLHLSSGVCYWPFYEIALNGPMPHHRITESFWLGKNSKIIHSNL